MYTSLADLESEAGVGKNLGPSAARVLAAALGQPHQGLTNLLKPLQHNAIGGK